MEEVGKTHGALTVTPTVLIAVATFPCQKTQPTLGLTRLYIRKVWGGSVAT